MPIIKDLITGDEYEVSQEMLDDMDEECEFVLEERQENNPRELLN